MPSKFDFGAILADLETFQTEVGKIHASLTSPRQKEILGEALQRVAEAKVDAAKYYPEAIKTIKERTQEAQARATATAAEAEVLRKKYEQMAKAPPEIPEPPAKETPAFDGQIGKKLSAELMDRLRAKPVSADSDPTADREIWQDWNWESGSQN